MDHVGFNSLIVRHHPCLKKIAEKYEDKYGETLIERVRSEAKGCYRDLALGCAMQAGILYGGGFTSFNTCARCYC